MSNRRDALVIYTGCSGVGKGTLMERLLKADESIRVSVSNTTREPRKGEIDGVHYNFVTEDEFESLIKKDGYLEYAKYCENYYGTPKQQVYDLLDKGYNVFLEIDVQGGLQVMEKYPDILSIFVLPPSMEELERRLRSRNTEDEETIQMRLAKAKEEMQFKDRYKYNVVNGDINAAVKEILDILHKEIEIKK